MVFCIGLLTICRGQNCFVLMLVGLFSAVILNTGGAASVNKFTDVQQEVSVFNALSMVALLTCFLSILLFYYSIQ